MGALTGPMLHFPTSRQGAFRKKVYNLLGVSSCRLSRDVYYFDCGGSIFGAALEGEICSLIFGCASIMIAEVHASEGPLHKVIGYVHFRECLKVAAVCHRMQVKNSGRVCILLPRNLLYSVQHSLVAGVIARG